MLVTADRAGLRGFAPGGASLEATRVAKNVFIPWGARLFSAPAGRDGPGPRLLLSSTHGKTEVFAVLVRGGVRRSFSSGS